MPSMSAPADRTPLGDSPFFASTKRALLRRRANALRALEAAERAEDAAAAAEARKQVQNAQRLILRYGLE
jgi:hypothetical protein